MTTSNALEVIITLKDDLFKQGISGVEKNMRSLGQNLTAIGQQAATAFLGMGTAMFVAAKAFGDFQQGMSNVSTLVDTSKESMAQMGQEVLHIAQTTPVAIHDLTDALYQIRSAGISAADALGVLDASARLGVAGLGSTQEAADLLTSAINVFSNEGLSANQIANILFKTVKEGKVKISELSQAFGSTAPIIHHAGVSLEDFQAATAALTVVGTPAAQAQNEIRAAVVALLKPTKDMTTVLEHLGAKSGPDLIRTSGGLGNAFKKVYDEADRMGVSIEKVTGRFQGSAAITAIATAGNIKYHEALQEMTNGVDEMGAAFEKQKATFESTIKILLNNLQILGITIGESLSPALTRLADMATKATQMLNQMSKPLKDILATGLLVTTAVTGIIAVFGLLSGALLTGTANIIKLTLQLKDLPKVITAVQGAVAVLGAELGISTGGLTLIIGGLVTAVAALAVAWATNFGGIQQKTYQVVEFIRLEFQNLAGPVSKVFNTIVTVVKNAFDFVVGTTQKAFSGIFNYVKTILSGVATSAGTTFDTMVQFAMSMLNDFKSIFNTLFFVMTLPFQNAMNVINIGLVALGQKPIVLQTMFKDLGSTMQAAALQATVTWKQAGQNIEAAMQKAKTAADNVVKGIPQDVKLPNVNLKTGNSAAAKKAARAEQKREKEELKAAEEALTQAITANKQAADANIASMGAYATEGMKLSAELVKLAADEKALLAARQKVASMKFTGDAEKDRLKELVKINQQIKQNAIDEQVARNNLAKFKIEDSLKTSLEQDQNLLDSAIAKMGAYANEGTKLSAELTKLKLDEMALATARQKVMDLESGRPEAERVAALQKVDEQLKKNHNDQLKLENEIYKFTIENNRKIADANEAMRQAEFKLNNEHLKNQEALEIQRLDDLNSKKEIKVKDYYTRIDAIEKAQADREKEEIQKQITYLTEKQSAMEKINHGPTAESIALAQQIKELTGQQIIIEDQLAQKRQQHAIEEKNYTLGIIQSFGTVAASYTNQVVNGIFAGNLKIKSLFAQLGQDIVRTLVDGAFKKIVAGFGNILKSSQQANAGMTQSTATASNAITQIHAQTSAAGISSWADLAVGAFNSVKAIFNAVKKGKMAEALILAPSSGQKAYDATVGIPYIGPFIAPAAYAAAFAFQVGKAALIAATSFDVGTPEVPQDMLAQIHEGEIIVPKNFADGIRGGDLALTGGSSTQGTTATSNEIHIHISGNSFYGTPQDIVNQIEKLLITKKNLIGTALGI